MATGEVFSTFCGAIQTMSSLSDLARSSPRANGAYSVDLLAVSFVSGEAISTIVQQTDGCLYLD